MIVTKLNSYFVFSKNEHKEFHESFFIKKNKKQVKQESFDRGFRWPNVRPNLLTVIVMWSANRGSLWNI